MCRSSLDNVTHVFGITFPTVSSSVLLVLLGWFVKWLFRGRTATVLWGATSWGYSKRHVVYFPSSFFSKLFLKVKAVQPWCSTDIYIYIYNIKLDTSHSKHLRIITGHWWPNSLISKKALYKICNAIPLSTSVVQVQWSTFGYVRRVLKEVPAQKSQEFSVIRFNNNWARTRHYCTNFLNKVSSEPPKCSTGSYKIRQAPEVDKKINIAKERAKTWKGRRLNAAVDYLMHEHTHTHTTHTHTNIYIYIYIYIYYIYIYSMFSYALRKFTCFLYKIFKCTSEIEKTVRSMLTHKVSLFVNELRNLYFHLQIRLKASQRIMKSDSYLILITGFTFRLIPLRKVRTSLHPSSRLNRITTVLLTASSNCPYYK